MRTIRFLIQKEFLQIFRNRSMLPIIFAVPVVQLIIIVQAATFEIRNAGIFVVDNDHTTSSRMITEQFRGSGFFRIMGYSSSYKEGEQSLRKGQTDAIIAIPEGFERKLNSGEKAEFQVVVNAINGSAGGLLSAYTLSMVELFNRNLMSGKLSFSMSEMPQSIEVRESYWYNPELNYTTFMVPGILVILVTVISLLLSGMNIVKEKEIGTIEQINVTPIRKYQFIAGKLIPTLAIALFELAFGLTIGKLIFNIPMEGNLLLVFGVATVYIVVILGIGLLVSTVTNTQQQAMFISFFCMIVFILMSGLFTSAEYMPDWAKYVNKVNPVAYFIRIVRMILLKGSGFGDFRTEFFSLVLLAFISLSLAIRRYRKTT